MQILTDVGEIAVHDGDRAVLLRPSLAAMASLGTPAEVVDTFGRVMAGDLCDCLAMVFACTDEDVTDLFGWFDASATGIVYRPGREPVGHIVAIAQCLARHGVTGALPAEEGDKSEYVGVFDARAYVAVAMAHLGLSEREAWNMTMTGLVGALRAKFPKPKDDKPGSNAPTVAEHTAAMAWLERVESARRKKQGAH